MVDLTDPDKGTIMSGIKRKPTVATCIVYFSRWFVVDINYQRVS